MKNTAGSLAFCILEQVLNPREHIEQEVRIHLRLQMLALCFNDFFLQGEVLLRLRYALQQQLLLNECVFGLLRNRR